MEFDIELLHRRRFSVDEAQKPAKSTCKQEQGKQIFNGGS